MDSQLADLLMLCNLNPSGEHRQTTAPIGKPDGLASFLVEKVALMPIGQSKQGSPIPGMQTGTGPRPVGNWAAQATGGARSFICACVGVRLHVRNYPLPPLPPLLSVHGARKVEDTGLQD